MDEKTIDPLKRVFVYNNNKFRTHDGVYYERRLGSGTIYRQIPKVRGKSARRADKQERKIARG